MRYTNKNTDVKGELVRNISKAIKRAKMSGKKEKQYMIYLNQLRNEYRAGREDGREEGREEGFEEHLSKTVAALIERGCSCDEIVSMCPADPAEKVIAVYNKLIKSMQPA